MGFPTFYDLVQELIDSALCFCSGVVVGLCLGMVFL